MLGATIASVALAVARQEITPAEAVREIRGWRRDKALSAGAGAQLKGALHLLRTESSRWKAAYNLLAWDADVWPPPDTRSGLRGPLKAMYETKLSESGPAAPWVREMIRDTEP
jgi:hypothetical protein